MIKYGSNQVKMEAEVPTVPGSYNIVLDPSGHTPAISTADTSVLTNKISSFFASQNQQSKNPNQNLWFKQL